MRAIISFQSPRGVNFEWIFHILVKHTTFPDIKSIIFPRTILSFQAKGCVIVKQIVEIEENTRNFSIKIKS